MGNSILIVIIIAIVCIVIYFLIEQENDYINDWANKKGLSVVKTEVHVTPIGSPFYYCDQGQFIYEVHLSDGSLWWYRTSIFGGDWEQEK